MRWELNIPALDLAKRRPGQSVRPITKDELRMDEAAFRAFYEETSCPLFAYLLIARVSAFFVAILAAPWLILESHQLWPSMADVWPRHLSFTNRLSPSDSNQTALLLAITGTILCIGLSSWYMLREEKPNEGSRT